MSYLLPHLRTGYAVDQAIVNEEDRVVVIRFGHDSDPTCMQMDEILCGIADDVKAFAVIYLVDITEVPDFNTMYELFDACTTMFFFRYAGGGEIVLEWGEGDGAVCCELPMRAHSAMVVTVVLRGKGVEGEGEWAGTAKCVVKHLPRLPFPLLPLFPPRFRLLSPFVMHVRSPRPPFPTPLRNKHIMIDLGTGNNNKINWAMNNKQEMIDIIETVYRGARKGRGLVVSPKDYSTKYRY